MSLASKVNDLATRVATEVKAVKTKQTAMRALADAWLPSGAVAATASRRSISSTAHAALTSGRLQMYGIYLMEGDVIEEITFVTGGTAGASLTHTWFALYAADRTLLRVTADDTSAAWNTHTPKTLALSSSYTVTTTGLYYIGIVVTGTTMPNFQGSVSPNANVNGTLITPVLAGTSTTGLTTPDTAPSPAAALTIIGGWAYAYVS